MKKYIELQVLLGLLIPTKISQVEVPSVNFCFYLDYKMGQVDIHLYKTEGSPHSQNRISKISPKKLQVERVRDRYGLLTLLHTNTLPVSVEIPSSSIRDADTGQKNCRAIFSFQLSVKNFLHEIYN